MSHDIYEPPFDPQDDTHPTQTFPAYAGTQPAARWRRLVGLLCLLGAAAFTAATVWMLLNPEEAAIIPPTQVVQATDAPVSLTESPPPVSVSPTGAATQAPAAQTEVVLPTLDPAAAASLLQTPLAPAPAAGPVQVEYAALNPFTIIPDRPRNEIITYVAVRGDTINGIAERFGLAPETIAWSNDRRIVLVLRPGDEVIIPPVDGVVVTAVGSTRTIADYARAYQVNDPFVVLESEFNNLGGLGPDSVPPSGTRIFIPGGIGEQITWTPAVVREEGGGGAQGNFISFAPGEAGSCGRVANPGGGGAWVRPVGGYTITRGYSTWHPGIDLAAAPGTPVYAANGGRVIFAGWNSFGYGYTVVLAHGPFTTLYGHLSTINVGCQQDVLPGQVIGGVGSTGNSSGPHLHFEIRYLDSPQDPGYTIAF